MRLSSAVAALSGVAVSVTALDAVEVYGNKFFNKDGSQFFIKGVAYQLSPDDPLIDTDQCNRDVGLMKELGANTLRVYHVDAQADHDGCMKTFADAGIYLLVDLDTFSTYILPEDLYWNNTQYERYAEVMDAFHDYDNLLGVFIGNENIAQKGDSLVAPFLKAAARDMKAYRDAKGYRKFPVGYSAADIKELRPMLQDYLTCGGNSSEIIDFYGLNSYSWCDPSDYKTATYDQLQRYAVDFPVPIFFTETGCIVGGPRTWQDQRAVFSKPMVDQWSGSIAYEWILEENMYGIVSYPAGADGAVGRSGTPTPKSPDFPNLKSRWAGLHPTGVMKSDYDPDSVSTRPCPSSTAGGWWRVDGNVALPTLGETMTGVFSTKATATSDPGDDGQNNSADPSDAGQDSDDAAAGVKPLFAFCATVASVVLGITLWL